jgi:hypothetical protein
MNLKDIQKKFNEKKEINCKISEQSAIEQVSELLSFYDINIDRLMQDEKTEKSGDSLLSSLVDFFRLGKIELKTGDKGKIIQYLKSGTIIEYGEISAKDKLAMDKFNPERENYNRVYAFMGSLCGLGKSAIEKLHVTDLAVVEVLGALFLLV